MWCDLNKAEQRRELASAGTQILQASFNMSQDYGRVIKLDDVVEKVSFYPMAMTIGFNTSIFNWFCYKFVGLLTSGFFFDRTYGLPICLVNCR
jgi:hypothetical protein